MINFRAFLESEELTLQYHDDLNPVLWKGESLDEEIRDHMLKIAQFFREYCKIPKDAVKDIVFTGGNANFNYTKFSDIDVHLIIDKKKLKVCDPEIMDDYLTDKKSLMALSHDIKIKGYSVELYAQDEKEATSGDQGVYSLKSNKWLKKPEKKTVNLTDPYLHKKIKDMARRINSYIDGKSNDVDAMNEYKEKIRKMRGAAIQKGGEFSIENLAFKELRNKGLLDKFSDYIKQAEDKTLSIN